MQTSHPNVKALTFDVFGTVVDWYSSIVIEGEKFGNTHNIDIDWAQFALKWRAGYGPAMDKVRRGELPWQNIDALPTLSRMISMNWQICWVWNEARNLNHEKQEL